jgi:hypothetical protein
VHKKTYEIYFMHKYVGSIHGKRCHSDEMYNVIDSSSTLLI